MADVIQSLWIGNRLSNMERMCIASYLHHGHPFHLYTYGPVDAIPEGAALKDANEILPESRIFKYANHASYAGFANYFRYKLLLDRGGWWVDMDLICLRAFEFPDPYVFSTEMETDGAHVNNGVIKAPLHSAAMEAAWSTCNSLDPKTLFWGQTGPLLLASIVESQSLERYVHPPRVFCPVLLSQWDRILDRNQKWDFPEQTHAVHLWNEMWRRENQPKDGTYAEGCLFEILKRRYLCNGA